MESWFEKLKQLWLEKDVEKISELMASEFVYYENPFEPPIRDVAKLKEVWNEVKDQEIELLEIVPLVTESNRGVARYHFKARISGRDHESKGAYFVSLDQNGKATEFRQWWNENDIK